MPCIADFLTDHSLPQVEKEVLVAAALGIDRCTVIAHSERSITDEESGLLSTMLARRRSGEPIAYITGEKEFYGRSFMVDKRVLIPRPSTEGLVALAIDTLKQRIDAVRSIDSGIIAIAKCFHTSKEPLRTVVDIGTGSGCIAITIALERPDCTVIATDTSAGALDVARENAVRYNVQDRTEFRRGSLLEPIDDLWMPFLIVSNPPYIPRGRRLVSEVEQYEPHAALYADDNGTTLLRAIMAGAIRHPHCMGVVFECEEEQQAVIERAN